VNIRDAIIRDVVKGMMEAMRRYRGDWQGWADIDEHQNRMARYARGKRTYMMEIPAFVRVETALEQEDAILD
jgi:hypothetical protein